MTSEEEQEAWVDGLNKELDAKMDEMMSAIPSRRSEQDKAIIKLLETTIHHLVQHTDMATPERTALLDQLREVKESFGVVQCGTGGE